MTQTDLLSKVELHMVKQKPEITGVPENFEVLHVLKNSEGEFYIVFKPKTGPKNMEDHRIFIGREGTLSEARINAAGVMGNAFTLDHGRDGTNPGNNRLYFIPSENRVFDYDFKTEQENPLEKIVYYGLEQKVDN
jgi:hypothetical protein